MLIEENYYVQKLLHQFINIIIILVLNCIVLKWNNNILNIMRPLNIIGKNKNILNAHKL